MLDRPAAPTPRILARGSGRAAPFAQHGLARESRVCVITGGGPGVLPGETAITAGPADTMTPPRGIPHATRNAGETPVRRRTFVSQYRECEFFLVRVAGRSSKENATTPKAGADRVSKVAAMLGATVALPAEARPFCGLA